MIKRATKDNLGEILKIYAIARKFMKATGNPDQWGSSRPSYDEIVKSIEEKNMYIIVEDDEIVASFTLVDYDKDYDQIIGKWINDDKYIAIHKIASSGRSRGIFKKILEFVKTKYSNIKIDTHKMNKIMQYHIKRNGFEYCGIVYIEGKLERLAYQLVLN